MQRLCNIKSRFVSLLAACLLVAVAVLPIKAFAQPFGTGIFNADVPFGGETSLTIATDGDLSVQVSPNSTATTTSNVTVTSSDVVGYKLYIRALTSTNLSGTGGNIPASANVSPGALATNTWGYNTDNSSDYIGITSSDVLLKSVTGPYTSGDLTQVYYGVNVDYTKAAGSYSSTIIYTAVPQTD